MEFAVNNVTLEELLRMTVPVGPGCIVPEDTPMSPDFRIAVQEKIDDGIRIIIHANGYDSDTLDFMVKGNSIEEI